MRHRSLKEERCKVVEVTYVPSSSREHVEKSIASYEFIHAMCEHSYAKILPFGKLVKALPTSHSGRPNQRVEHFLSKEESYVGLARGPFYWCEMEPREELWWRISVPINFKRMPLLLVKSRRRSEDCMRLALVSQITQQGLGGGPYFIETIWNEREKRKYWFDFYARERSDLMGYRMLFT